MIVIRCRECGNPCVLRSSESLVVAENTYQTIRRYKCKKCGKRFKVVDDPVQIVRGED